MRKQTELVRVQKRAVKSWILVPVDPCLPKFNEKECKKKPLEEGLVLGVKPEHFHASQRGNGSVFSGIRYSYSCRRAITNKKRPT